MPMRSVRLAVLSSIAGAAVWLSGPISAGDDETYELDYLIDLVPADGIAEVRVALDGNAELVREIRFHIDPDRQRGFGGDGEIDADGEYVTWQPPEDGGSIVFEADIDHERDPGGYDAFMTDEWAVFRGDDLVPPAHVRTAAGAEARARLKVTAPEDWSVVTPYPGIDDGWVRVEHADRRFDRPTGWMAAGDLGVRRERIRGVEVAVAGPVDQGVRRLDILAFLNWNLPEVLRVFDHFPEMFVVVSAGDPMWRGGLSGPGSIFLHADRPLISENGTSTLMHELVHIGMGVGAENGNDWIVEGLAEFYALEIMRRSGTISQNRYERAYERLREWSDDVDDLAGGSSQGANTARAVLVFRELDEEIRDETDGDASIDDVAHEIADSGEPVTLEQLREIAGEVAGESVDALESDNLPGM